MTPLSFLPDSSGACDPYTSAFDDGVLCSLGSPLAALEMTVVGLPVVVSDVDYAAEMVASWRDQPSRI
jgi:hypothetical protein